MTALADPAGYRAAHDHLERTVARRIAALLPGIAVPVLAYRERRPTRIAYAHLTGNGPKDRQPFTTDTLERAS